MDSSVKLYPSLTAKEGLNFLIYSFASKFNHTRLLQRELLTRKESEPAFRVATGDVPLRKVPPNQVRGDMEIEDNFPS